MRKLTCSTAVGGSVKELLDEFNERINEFGIEEKDIISVSALPSTLSVKAGKPNNNVQIVIFHWANN